MNKFKIKLEFFYSAMIKYFYPLQYRKQYITDLPVAWPLGAQGLKVHSGPYIIVYGAPFSGAAGAVPCLTMGLIDK